LAEIWILRGALQRLLGLSKSQINRTASGQNWKWRMSETRGANGKHEREYLLGSLPAEAQMKYATENSALVKTSSNALAPGSLPLFEQAESPAARAAIPEHLEPQARERYNAIAHLIDYRARTNGTRPSLTLGGKKIRNTNDLAAHLAKTHEVCESTIWSWYRKFKKGGFNALPDGARSDAGKSRFFLEHPKAAAWIQSKYLVEGLDNAYLIWEALQRDWAKIEHKGQPPSYPTVRTFLSSLPKPMRTLALVGPEAYHSQHSPFILRSDMPAMDWWILDHRMFDVLVRNTLFDELPREKAFRLWLTAIYDWGSRKIVGFCLAPTPSSRTINSALRLAILQYGFPRNFYWDRGEDFKKVRRDFEAIALSDGANALLAGQRLANITCALPKHPRSKPIESYFSRWAKRFDILWRASGAYIGNKPGNCPESGRIAQHQHALYLKQKRSTSPLPADSQFILSAIQWMDEYNSTRLESLDHRSPNEVMDEQFPLATRPQVNPRALDLLFSERVERVIGRGGSVQLDRMSYEPTDESLCAFSAREGRKVWILRDPYNLSDATGVDIESPQQFIGELHVQFPMEQSPNGYRTRDQIQARMRRERGLKRGYADFIEFLRGMGQAQGWRTEAELLLDRGSRTGTDNRALPAGAAPGARSQRALPERVAPDSPFVDDAAANVIAAFEESD
jgi:transposase InsO family protein